MTSSSLVSTFRETLAQARARISANDPDATQSRRTPNRDTRFNDADNLERQMREDGHSKWGWLIYRCTYDNDEQWQAFLERFEYYVHATLAADNGEDLASSLEIIVLSHRESFEDATPDVVRQYFRPWADVASMEEQGRPAGRAQRYRYCLHVDQECVESVLAGPEPPEDSLGGGFVNLVRCEEGIETPDPDPEGEELQLDPTYMRISYSGLLVTWYNLFRSEGAWETEYRQPPAIGRP